MRGLVRDAPALLCSYSFSPLKSLKEHDMSELVRVHMRVPGTAPLPELMTLFQNIEDAGFDGAGILDSQMIGRDTFVILGHAAAHTKRMQLFPAVTNPLTRHAAVLASGIQTVEEIAPGRIKCVIGTGYSSAATIGRKPATLAAMRECIGAVKTLLAGGKVDWNGKPAGLSYASGRRIPVLMAASGPKAMELAGEIADGVLLLVGFNNPIIERSLGLVERGAKKSGRRLEDLEINWAVRVGTAATMTEARRVARPVAVHWALRYGKADWLESIGIHWPKIKTPEAVDKIYPDLSHAENWEEAIEVTSFVPDETIAQVCEALGLAGTPEYCAQRIIETTKLGVRNIYLMPFQTFAAPDDEVASFRDVIFPRLKSAGLR
jgi:5,10-methylenetetrahydromethanopterin reductase